MLKAVVANLDEADEADKGKYKKGEDGKFHLEVDGMVDKAKLDAFRENNISLQKQVDDLKAAVEKFSGIDPEQYKAAMSAIESDVEKKLLKEGKIEDVFSMRTEKMRQSYEQQLKAKDTAITKAQEESKKANGERDSYIVDAELRKSLEPPELGYQVGVADLLKEQVLKEFAYRDGKVIRLKADGTPAFGAKGDPATIGEFLTDIVKDRPYLLKPSAGSGARNNGNAQLNGTKTMRRAEFDAITDAAKKSEVARSGVVFVD